MAFKSVLAGFSIAVLVTGSALAISVGELAGTCGDDGKAYCEGVGYGAAMQVCLNDNYRKLTPQCKGMMVRLNDGERVTLF